MQKAKSYAVTPPHGASAKNAKTLVHVGHKQLRTPDFLRVGPGLGETSKAWAANGTGPE